MRYVQRKPGLMSFGFFFSLFLYFVCTERDIIVVTD
jgi:hypothetical protein